MRTIRAISRPLSVAMMCALSSSSRSHQNPSSQPLSPLCILPCSDWCVGCEEVEYGTVPIHRTEEVQKCMCCHTHLDAAWLHVFFTRHRASAQPAWRINHGHNHELDGSSVPVRLSKSRRIRLNLFFIRSNRAFCRICSTVMSWRSFQQH